MFLHSIKKLVLFHDILLIVKREGEREKIIIGSLSQGQPRALLATASCLPTFRVILIRFVLSAVNRSRKDFFTVYLFLIREGFDLLNSL